MSRKLDVDTKKEWEEFSISKFVGLPSIEQFTSFLSNRCQMLESIEISNKSFKNSSTKRVNDEKLTSHVVTQNPKCEICKGSHYVYKCQKLLALPVAARLDEIKKCKLCLNCLRPNHYVNVCWAEGCKKCKRRHNTLLHNEKCSDEVGSNAKEANQMEPSTSGTQTCHYAVDESTKSTQIKIENELLNMHCLQLKKESQVILSTAIIHIADRDGNFHNARCLLDSGSQSSFLSTDILKKLNLPVEKINLPILGVNQVATKIKFKTQATIKSRYSHFQENINFLILDKITSNIPTTFDISKLKIPENVTLADPNFNISGKIDILLGAGIFFDILCAGQIKLGHGMPTLQKSLLGWIVAGPMTIYKLGSEDKMRTCHLLLNQTVQDQLERFWLVEECEVSEVMSKEHRECEQDFINTVTRDETGRFVVKLPMREGVGELGDSFEMARKRFFTLERKLSKNIEFKQKYCEFMKEYVDMGHMSRIEVDENNSSSTRSGNNQFYLPHHGVVNESSSTTKLRIVFDGSAKTSSGISLNDILKIGPSIQDDLFTILIRFRKHNIVITSDIAKMYRMINVVDSQRDLQRIIWRSNPELNLDHFCLNTVTYGTGPASYLATRCLKQISNDIKNTLPLISKIISQDFYVDDLITGADSVDEAIQIGHEISKILRQYGFILRKWNSSEHDFLSSLMDEQSNELGYFITDDDTKKTLGVFWKASDDELEYIVNSNPDSSRTTKRTILPLIAKIFDPLGLVGPVTIRAKIILQRLWLLKLQWDEAIPLELFTLWNEFKNQLPLLNNIKIQRQCTIKNFVSIEIHAFCDASQKASGAAIYLRTKDCHGQVSVRLLCSKSRVAPIKTISVPRLELCGAVLAARLASRVSNALEIESVERFYWTDSSIVLAWLAEQPNVWKTFVSNRVSEIQQITDVKRWGHVPSRENPADIISRGISPGELGNHSLWWYGPPFLLRERNFWPKDFDLNLIDIPEKRKPEYTLLNVEPDITIFTRFSSLYKLQRVVALCIRFYKNISSNKNNKSLGNLSIQELNEAMTSLIKVVQFHEYKKEFDALNNSQVIPRTSNIKSFDPFLDDDKVIRVGGRLRKSMVTYNSKFPIILPARHPLTRLIIRSEHLTELHAGAQAIFAKIRQNYWIINGRRAVRSVLSKCIVCFKSNPKGMLQKMGDLPRDRITPNRPFLICGTDYGGPFNLKDGKARNRTIIKAYLCIFICFSTKAVHLELVGDLSTEAFLNSLKRFVSRRGLCAHIYSDNGTNYVGANNELQRISNFFAKVGNESDISNFCSQNKIEWHFIAPRSPHQGGLWESAIKSAKHHLTRVVGNNNLTFEELTTVFAQIEAVLNSRPLTELSNDPNDLSPLTPGHFLIGGPLNSIPQCNVMDVPENRVTKYQLLQRMVQHFWSRWSQEYLSSLQQRSKWHSPSSTNLKIDSLVIIKEDNSPPLSWKLGRVIKLYEGSDKLVRVVDIKTSNGVLKRSVQKICVLPIHD